MKYIAFCRIFRNQASKRQWYVQLTECVGHMAWDQALINMRGNCEHEPTPSRKPGACVLGFCKTQAPTWPSVGPALALGQGSYLVYRQGQRPRGQGADKAARATVWGDTDWSRGAAAVDAPQQRPTTPGGGERRWVIVWGYATTGRAVWHAPGQTPGSWPAEPALRRLG